MKKVKLIDVVFDEISQMGIIILEDENSYVLPIWIGIFESQAIMFKLQGMYFPRPLTHDLFGQIFNVLNVKVEYVLISSVKENTYYAEIHLIKDNEKFVIDSRPSDAVAIAVRINVPIYVADEVMHTAGMKKEEFLKQQKEKFFSQILELSDFDNEKKLKH